MGDASDTFKAELPCTTFRPSPTWTGPWRSGPPKNGGFYDLMHKTTRICDWTCGVMDLDPGHTVRNGDFEDFFLRSVFSTPPVPLGRPNKCHRRHVVVHVSLEWKASDFFDIPRLTGLLRVKSPMCIFSNVRNPIINLPFGYDGYHRIILMLGWFIIGFPKAASI